MFVYFSPIFVLGIFAYFLVKNPEVIGAVFNIAIVVLLFAVVIAAGMAQH